MIFRNHSSCPRPCGGYLRTFEMPRPIAFVEQLTIRYTAKRAATNAVFSTAARVLGDDLKPSLVATSKQAAHA